MKAKSSKKTIQKKKNKALALTPEYRETLKFKSWCQNFLDPQSKTYGNATQSALQVYNTEDANTAGVIGHENLRKLKSIGMIMVENEGMPYKEFMKIGMAKMLKEGYDTWEKFGIRIGFLDAPAPTTPGTIQFNFNDIAVAINKSSEERGLPPL